MGPTSFASSSGEGACAAVAEAAGACADVGGAAISAKHVASATSPVAADRARYVRLASMNPGSTGQRRTPSGSGRLFHRIAASLKARATGVLIRLLAGLLLLARLPLLLLRLRRVLSPALAARRRRACGRACARVAAYDFTDDCTACSSARTGAARATGRRGRRVRGRCGWRRVGGVVFALLYGPRMTLGFVLLLLLGRLPLGWIDELLCRRAGRDNRRDDEG